MTSIIIPGPEGDANANLIIKSNSHLALPSGTDAGRTVSGYTNEPGNIRYNTNPGGSATSGSIEYYKSTTAGWVQVLDVETPISSSDHSKPLFLDNNGKITFSNIPLDNISGIDTTGASDKDILVRSSNSFVTRTIGGDVSVALTSSNLDYTLTASSITAKTELSSSAASDDVLLVYDTSSTQLKKITSTNLLAGVAIATTTTVGVVKPDGTTIGIDANGTLSVGGSGGGGLVTADGVTILNNNGTLSAATATTSAKGIVQPDGSTITISNGVISAAGGSGLQSRTTASGSTGSIANAQASSIDINVGSATCVLMKMQTSAAAWVTFYSSSTARTNDASRAEGTDPTAGSGVMAEAITTSASTVLFSPSTLCFMDPSQTSIPIKVVNKSGAAANITITLTVLKLEA